MADENVPPGLSDDQVIAAINQYSQSKSTKESIPQTSHLSTYTQPPPNAFSTTDSSLDLQKLKDIFAKEGGLIDNLSDSILASLTSQTPPSIINQQQNPHLHQSTESDPNKNRGSTDDGKGPLHPSAANYTKNINKIINETIASTFNTGNNTYSNIQHIDKSKLYLSITISKGLAFLGVSEVTEDATTSLQIHILFNQHRVSSNNVLSSTDPSFQFQRLLELPSKDIPSLLASYAPITILVTRTHHPSETSSFLGIKIVEWRDALTGGVKTCVVELKDPTLGGDVTVGILECHFEVVPRGLGGWVSSGEVAFQIKKESKQEEEVRRLFYVYTKRWWNDFLQIRSSHGDRSVKLFAEDSESKKIPVTNFIQPIQSRYIESPAHAARFVSLIPVDKKTGIGSAKLDIWPHPFTTLTLSKASPPAHALLLTSLLLGFSLNAYMTYGTTTTSPNPVYWVTTIDPITYTPEFWDPVTGCKTSLDDASLVYRRIGTLFHDEGLWACVSLQDDVRAIPNWDIRDTSVWKPLGRDAVLSMKRPTPSFTLQPYIDIPRSLEIDIESLLRSNITMYRQDHDLTTMFDDTLSHLLTQCLVTLETSKLKGTQKKETGGSSGDIMGGVYFQQGVKRAIPEGHTFKGFPCLVHGTEAGRIFSTLLKVKGCRDILVTRGDVVRFGVRVKIVGYAEKVAACWVMIAVRYRAL